MGCGIAALVTIVPLVSYRWHYTHCKRLREVVPGLVYRSGQMSAAGFTETVERYGIRTIINLQDEYPDPDVLVGYFNCKIVKESELCGRLGVRYVYLPPDVVSRQVSDVSRPAAIDHFLEVMDDPQNYPVLIHCRAGLHRTGVFTALYRIEYQDWDALDAIRELKANGFGRFACSSANSYVWQYVLNYRPGVRTTITEP